MAARSFVVLQDVERCILVSGKARGVIKQRTLHHCDQVPERHRIARLAAERKPLKPDSIVAFIGHLSNMSKRSRSRFNSPFNTLAEIL